MAHEDTVSYYSDIRAALESAFNFQMPSSLHEAESSDRYRYPEVEVQEDPELLPQATLITTSLRECCLVEGSSNSVRVSLRLGQATACQESLQKMFLRFMMKKADRLDLLRRVPVSGYDVTFLVTARHLVEMGPEAIISFICGFTTEVAKELEKLEGLVRSHGNSTASELLRGLAF